MVQQCAYIHIAEEDFIMLREGTQDKNSTRGRSKSRNKDKSKSRPGRLVTYWNYDKIGHIKRNCKNSKKTENDSANVVTKVQDALQLAVYNSIDDWILNSRASFHTFSH